MASINGPVGIPLEPRKVLGRRQAIAVNIQDSLVQQKTGDVVGAAIVHALHNELDVARGLFSRLGVLGLLFLVRHGLVDEDGRGAVQRQ